MTSYYMNHWRLSILTHIFLLPSLAVLIRVNCMTGFLSFKGVDRFSTENIYEWHLLNIIEWHDILMWVRIGLSPRFKLTRTWFPITSYNVLFCNRNLHICAYFCYKMVHCGIFSDALWDFFRWVYLCIYLIPNVMYGILVYNQRWDV